MTDIYKTKVFNRWSEKEGLTDTALCNAIDEVDDGKIEASLGVYLFKKRVARPGQGKSGSYRTIIALKREEKAFFLFGFAKGSRCNISDKEEKALKKLSKHFMGCTNKELERAVENGALIEVECEDE
jgi:hypothetical protein